VVGPRYHFFAQTGLKAWTARLARLCEDAKDYRATAVLLLSKHYVGGAAGALLLAL